MIKKDADAAALELYPASDKARVVCVMTGSDGGINWARQIAKRFQKRGVPACALAYWKYKSLPKKLSCIPVEAVRFAVRFLREQGYRSVALYGISKGAELALLSACLLSDIGAVVAVSPSCLFPPGTIPFGPRP